MNMNSNIKCGTSINGGMVLTDMSIEVLKAMRDAIDDAINKAQNEDCDRLLTDIVSAIDAARDEGYEVWYGDDIFDMDYLHVEPNEDDEDDYYD